MADTSKDAHRPAERDGFTPVNQKSSQASQGNQQIAAAEVVEASRKNAK